jgi:predicted DNA binding CopG/RHH family protein
MITMPKKRIPDFKSDEEAAEFWDTHSLADYWDDTQPAEDVEFRLRPLKQISLRLAPGQIERLKQIAARKGIGYQTMLRMWVTERVREEERAA